MLKVYIKGVELERAVHELTLIEMEQLEAYLEESGQDLEELLLEGGWDENPIYEWYDGVHNECAMCFEPDNVTLDEDYVEEPLENYTIENTNYTLFDVLSCVDEKDDNGPWTYETDTEFLVIAEHISKGGYYCELPVTREDFESEKLVFVTSTYVGEYMYTDQLLDAVYYDGELLELECDGTTGKSFDVQKLDIQTIRDEEPIIQKGD